MKAVRLQGEYYIVLIPEARVELVLPREQFIEALRRAKHWKRRHTQEQREAEAATIAAEKRARLLSGAR